MQTRCRGAEVWMGKVLVFFFPFFLSLVVVGPSAVMALDTVR